MARRRLKYFGRLRTQASGCWVIAAMLGFACERPKHPSNPAILDEICQPLCSKRHGCDASLEVEPCVTRCRDGGPRRIYWREDHVTAIRACIDRVVCGPDLDQSIRRSCFVDTAASVQPTPA